MALRRQSLSPTASLLRTSRLFSLPAPLPRPVVGETSGAGVTKTSDSATLPYPTHQAIATTKSSLARGDWGLKRNLPARSHVLQTSDPVLRVSQLDTIEHVTDFDSAADHVRTRQKWEQTATPMLRGMAHLRAVDLTGPGPAGAFEPRDDTTAYDSPLGLDENGLFLQALRDNQRARDAAERRAGRPQPFAPFKPPPVDADVHNARRWKHDGPWLPGQSAAEFVAYLNSQIARREPAFRAHLVEYVKNEIYTTRQLAAARAGERPPIDAAEAQRWQAAREAQWADISQRDIDAVVAVLRKETASDPLGSRLVNKLIMPFLRLPPIRFRSKVYDRDASTRDADHFSFDPDFTPLSTHPSAGLGYLRTKAYLANHPILGPQASTAPIPARVLQPRITATSKESYARLGLAGFVANDQHLAAAKFSSGPARSTARDVETIDIDTPGGRKIHVVPHYASVANDGRIHIKLSRADGAHVAVARGDLADRAPRAPSKTDAKALLDRKTPRRGLARARKSGVPALDQLADARTDSLDGARELHEMSAQGKQFADFLSSADAAPKADTP